MNTIVLSALSFALIGCGGGSSSNNDSNSENDSNEVQQQAVSLKNSDYVKGIYNISVSGDSATDEAYLHIDETGLITTYDFLGDSFDNGENCYSKNPSNLNDVINGTTLTIDESTKQFISNGYMWTYDETKKNITKVGMTGLTVGSLFSTNGIRIATSSLLVTSPSVSDMEQLLCE